MDDNLIADFIHTKFIISGYNFVSGKVHQKIILYDNNVGKYIQRGFRGFTTGRFSSGLGFIGDKRVEFMSELARLAPAEGKSFNYEPLVALNNVITKQDRLSSVGGFPQVVKVYRHRNYLPFAIRKTDDNYPTVTSLFGRPLMDYEKTFYPIIDLDVVDAVGDIDYPMAAIANRDV